jgi:hypothetical protein
MIGGSVKRPPREASKATEGKGLDYLTEELELERKGLPLTPPRKEQTREHLRKYIGYMAVQYKFSEARGRKVAKMNRAKKSLTNTMLTAYGRRVWCEDCLIQLKTMEEKPLCPKCQKPL